MDKWADYCISKVSYTPQRTHISTVIVNQDKCDLLGPDETWARTEVIAKIKAGNSFVTIILDSGTQKYQKGQPVRIIKVDGTEYVRTDANSKATDNLEDLPEF